MKTLKVIVPKVLVFEETIKFSKHLSQLTFSEHYVFDFSNTKKIDPFSLLYLSSEIQLCRSTHKESKFTATNYGHLTYMAHMGFFRAFGMSYGKKPGEAKGSQSYIPIQLYDVYPIKKDAADLKINVGVLLENEAQKLSKVLAQSDQGNLYDLLVYSMREILRNVVEHSEANQFGFCAQYLPSRQRVSLAILDRGIGIKNALSFNPNLNISSDEQALLEAIKPGVSGKVFKGQKRKPKGIWANSGFGLYMTSNICINGGSFFIASGTKGLYISENKQRFLETPINGTALNLILDVSNINKLYDRLTELRNKADTNTKASKSSMGLSKSIK